MRSTWSVLLALLVTSACSPAAPPKAPPAAARPVATESEFELTKRLLAGLYQAGECTDGRKSAVCVAPGWAGAGAASTALPTQTLLVGLSIVMPDGTPADEIVDPATGFMHVAAMGLRIEETARFIRIAPLVPNTPDEDALIRPVFEGLLAHFAGLRDHVVVPPDLGGYLADLPAAARYPLARVEGGGWAWQGASHGELRRVGDYWVAVEWPAQEKGLTVTVFTQALR